MSRRRRAAWGWRCGGALATIVALGLSWPAAAETPVPPARFAIVVGVNQSVDHDAALLHYADDDAARFQELFRTLGARTYLLTRNLRINNENIFYTVAAFLNWVHYINIPKR